MNPAQGHQPQATFQNRMNGSERNCNLMHNQQPFQHHQNQA